MKTALRRVLAFALAVSASNVAATECAENHTLIGEDENYYYCIKTGYITVCRNKRTDVNACIRAACVRTAGETLETEIVDCQSDNKACRLGRGACKTQLDECVARRSKEREAFVAVCHKYGAAL
jgi:hypothetical protein